MAIITSRDHIDYDELKKRMITEISESGHLIEVVGLCSGCQSGKLIQKTKYRVKVDICPKCNGIFFDYGELPKLLDAIPLKTSWRVLWWFFGF